MASNSGDTTDAEGGIRRRIDDRSVSAAYNPYKVGWPLLNDVGNAERLVAQWGNQLKYVRDVGWHVWDGRRWIIDDCAAQQMAQDTSKSIFDEAKRSDDLGANQKRISDWAIASGQSSHIAGMLKQAEPHLVIAVSKMDADPFLINCMNGTFDLKSGSLREHDPSDLITKLAPVNYDAAARADNWRAFMERVVPALDVREFLQRWAGYTLTGVTDEQAFVFLHGTGANGKSTYIETLRREMGDYSAGIPFESLRYDDRKRGGDASPELARLTAVRMAISAEPETGDKFSEATIKLITGGDLITTRHLYKNPFEFKPAFKVYVAGNHKPNIRGVDEGIWRRVILVPFEEFIPEEERRKDLADILWQEAAGIFAWMVEGAKLWQQDGLRIPHSVSVATKEYRQENDRIGGFMDDATISGGTCQATLLFQAYRIWCAENGETPVNQRMFGTMLRERGIKKEKRGVFFYDGLQLTVEWDLKVQSENANQNNDV